MLSVLQELGSWVPTEGWLVPTYKVYPRWVGCRFLTCKSTTWNCFEQVEWLFGLWKLPRKKTKNLGLEKKKIGGRADHTIELIIEGPENNSLTSFRHFPIHDYRMEG
jgi:hypothetical protein